MSLRIIRKIKETIGVMVRSKPLKACISMTLGLCFHFLGYECARAASITLLAAKEIGLGNEAIPLTIALGSPLSGLTLYLYTKSIKKYGSKFTLRVSFAVCILFMALITLYGRTITGMHGKAAIVAFYAFREIYVSLLSSQQWAFIAGTLNKSTSSYIVVFSGIVSVASAVGGCSIEQLVGMGGVQALLSTALLATVASCLCAEFAYTLTDVIPLAPGGHSAHTAHSSSSSTAHATETHSTTSTTSTTAAAASSSKLPSQTPEEGRDALRRRRPAAGHAEQPGANPDKAIPVVSNKYQSSKYQRQDPIPAGNTTEQAHSVTTVKVEKSHIHTTSDGKRKGGFWVDSWNLICSHRLLQILFVEGLLHQMCGNMLNLMFHNGLRLEIQDDAMRARLVGRFFATVNVTSCALQCFVLPHILSHSTLASILAHIPVFLLIATCYGAVNPGLISVMLGFGTIKVLEYSIMHSASEMIYMPMGHEVRYLGKELIRFFGHKLGKSGSSLVLSALVSQLQPSLSMQCAWGAVLTLCWGGSMVALANSVRERDREEEELQQQRTAREKTTTSASAGASTSAGVDDASKRRKIRSFSYDDYAVRHRSSSKATARVHGSGLKRPERGGGPSCLLSVSLDQAQSTRKELHGALQNLSEREPLWEEEEIPLPSVDPGQAAPAAVTHHDANLPSQKPAEASTPLAALVLPTLVETDCLDTLTDASGSPEVSLCSQSQRSHGDSVDSLASLGQDFERGESFSEGLADTFTPRELGISDAEDDQVRMHRRRGLSSTDSLASMASRDRRESWERDQRLRESMHRGHAQEQQPVMLRVGSVSVNLNTFTAMAKSRNGQSHSP